ncbi:hypothetical protein CAN33_0020090 [Aspergillus niger]|uniref:Uncharacterized protein n=1 Tax=Aspergillus niger TaxID=5061 RepID=A0A505I2H0_ASPNG|nr:hypothetical protein CAN33_0020090 [Aspergillus niger]
MNTFHAGETPNFGLSAPDTSCFTAETCELFQGFGQGTGDSGAAAMVIYNCFSDQLGILPIDAAIRAVGGTYNDT